MLIDQRYPFMPERSHKPDRQGHRMSGQTGSQSLRAIIYLQNIYVMCLACAFFGRVGTLVFGKLLFVSVL